MKSGSAGRLSIPGAFCERKSDGEGDASVITGVNRRLADYCGERRQEFDRIPTDRRRILEDLARAVGEMTEGSAKPGLIFICTHNSRRSHFAQIWAQTAARICGVSGMETFSGGTEVSAFNPRAVAAIERAGFLVEASPGSDNPTYLVRFDHDVEPMRCFSKIYDQPPNPTEDFVAVMTCSDADAACPVVFGASERFAIPYEDPKASDGTDRESRIYDERCREIAREMLFLFSRISAE